MKQKLFMMLAALMLLGTSAMAQSETLKGDVNADGVVDVADIAAVIAIMAKEAEGQPAYYWYVGLNKPTTSTDPTTELATADDAMGWHKIGSLLGTYSKGSPLWAGASQGKVINLNPDYDDVTFYVALPVGIGIYDGLGNEVTHKFTLVSSDVYIAGRNYNVYSDLNSEFGLLLY